MSTLRKKEYISFMAEDNYRRMLQLATDFFDVKNDPSQLDIDESVINRLTALHPATMGEIADNNGPIAWTIVIPASMNAMDQFLKGALTESALLDLCERENRFETVYLCSALVLPEYRGRGLVKQLVCTSIHAIQRDHHLAALFCWSFSIEGEYLSRSIAKELQLPLHIRTAS